MNHNIEDIKKRYSIVGHNEGLLKALRMALMVAPADLSVLIQGESGTGKEVLPRIIHDFSARKTKNYLAINCGSIPEGTIDSELFGHEKGAFTDAMSDHAGYFETADGGTLFLDEVGELPLSTQARLLRVLETGEYLRVGGNQPRTTNVRVVAATNVNMQQAIRDGRFRADLYYRLCGVTIPLPPLRERGEDVLKLFRHFSIQAARAYHTAESLRLAPDAERIMMAYPWPGNIRQLRNIADQLTVLCQGSTLITAQVLEQYGISANSTDIVGPIGTGKTTDEMTGRIEFLEKLVGQLFNQVQALNEVVKGSSLKDNTFSPDASHLLAATPATPMAHPHVTFPPSDHSIDSVIISQPHTYHEEKEQPNPMEYVEEIKDDNELNLEQLERATIEKALRKYRNRRNKAAEALGISQRTLYRKIEQYNIKD